MRCEPKLSGARLTQTMWLKTLTSIFLLTLTNAVEHYKLVELVFPYHLLVNLLINNFVCVCCSHREIHFFWDFIWKLATALSQLNVYCFQVKLALDTFMIFKQIVDHFQTQPMKRLHKVNHHDSVTTYLEPRPSIHKSAHPNHIDAKVTETFLAHKIFSLNLGKSSKKMQRNFKSSESDTFGGFDFSKVKLNSSGSRGESRETSSQGVKDSQVGSWGQSPPSNSPRYRTSSGGSPAQTSSSLLKPARLSFSPPESVQSPSTSETSLSQTLFYSSTPRVVYVQIPSAVAEQGYLKLVCYLFTLVIVYIIYNEYRISKMYGTGHT
ncbi:hypothetical protein M8J76_008891 [Diaphorina citri]|nr:hypothetical protein M8J76_008891 [Diaphorina citri]